MRSQNIKSWRHHDAIFEKPAAQITKRARISHSTLLRIENESRKPSLDTLLRIAEAMDMEIWPLIKEAERKVGLPQDNANSQ